MGQVEQDEVAALGQTMLTMMTPKLGKDDGPDA